VKIIYPNLQMFVDFILRTQLCLAPTNMAAILSISYKKAKIKRLITVLLFAPHAQPIKLTKYLWHEQGG
jgi:hypothetical protein